MQNCWHSDPTKRPTAAQIYEVTNSWLTLSTQEIKSQIKEAEKICKQIIKEKKPPHLHKPIIDRYYKR